MFLPFGSCGFLIFISGLVNTVFHVALSGVVMIYTAVQEIVPIVMINELAVATRASRRFITEEVEDIKSNSVFVSCIWCRN